MFLPNWRRIAFVSAGLLGLALLFLAVVRFFPVWSTGAYDPSPAPSTGQQSDAFFESYWQRPILPQGSSPASFTEKEGSLSARACGSCHLQQYTNWSESFHGKAMGAGPWGQIVDLTRNSPEQAAQCLACHAPLSEQNPHLISANAEMSTVEKNSAFDPELQLQGITCAACHVRRHERFGPPKAEGAKTFRYPEALPNHGGVKRTPYFEKAEFCRDCHQFDPDNESLSVNGKPMQDTFREWRASTWGKGGVACQECHMPNRRHFWRGIHDPEMVEDGLRMEVGIARRPSTAGGVLELTVEVKNVAVGHKFPTYITPKIFVRAALLDRTGKSLAGTLQEKIIGWDVRFDSGEWKEYFDTRIAPGEGLRYGFRWKRLPGTEKVRTWLEVHPDHFYHFHFYPTYLKQADLSPDGRRLVERALRESGRTAYILFDQAIPIEDP